MPGRLDGVAGNGNVQWVTPGETVSGTIDIINPAAYQYLTFASMIIPSNDGFFGNEAPDAYQVFDDDGNFTGDIEIVITGADIYDSGTEVNNGSGAAGFSLGLDGLGSGDSTDDPESLVGPHPDLFENIVGFQNVAGTTIGSDGSGAIELDEEIARITVTVEGVDAPPAPANDVYQVRNVDFDAFLAVDGRNVVHTPDATDPSTLWEVIRDGDFVYFRSTVDGRFLDVDANNVDLSADLASTEGRFEVEESADGYTLFRNTDNNELLDADRGRSNVDTNRSANSLGVEWELIPTGAAGGDVVGAVYVATNDLENNEVAAFGRLADGTLVPLGNFATGGAGSTEFDGGEGLDPLISADSLVVTEDEQFLLVVNAGSDSISSFYINDDFTLELIDVEASGGVGPNSLAVDDGLVFVTNIDRDGFALGDPDTPRGEPNDEGNVVGFYLADDGDLTPNGQSADLDNRPANIAFSSDGDRLIVSSITSGSAALPGPNAEASIYAFDILRSGRLQLADTGTPTLRGNEEGRNLPSAIDFDIANIDGQDFIVVTEAREFNSEGAPPALPALQAGSVTVYALGDDSSLTITERDLATTDGDPAAPNAFGADGQQLTACWIDFGSDGRTFYVSNAINSTISSFRLEDDGSVTIIDTTAAAGTSGFETPGVAQDGPTTFGRTDGFIDLDVSPDGGFLYQLEGLSGNIGVYEIGHDGGLELIQELSGELPEIDTQGLISIGG